MKKLVDQIGLNRFGLQLVLKTEKMEVFSCLIPDWGDEATIRVVGFVGKEFWILSNNLTGRGAATDDVYGVVRLLHRWFDEAERARIFGGIAPYIN